jgi:AbrB family looped-hinge helix DNA binding protein
MQTTSVTSKGQITLPKNIREQLGINAGCKMQATIVGDHIELRLSVADTEQAMTGFGMLKSHRTAVPVDFDPASLLNNDRS